MPQLQGEHIDIFLTNMSLQYKNADFIGERMAPPVMVEKESDKILVYSRDMMFNTYDDQRADGAESAMIDWSLGTPISYAVEEHALSDIVTDRERRNSDNPLQPDIDTLEFLQNAIGLGKETRVASLLTDAATYPAGNTSAAANKWSDYTNSKPWQDMRDMQKAVFDAVRMKANTAMIPYEIALQLSQHPDTLELIKYTTNVLTMGKDIILPQNMFGLNLVIAGSGQNTAKKGKTPTIANVWGSNVIVGYIEPQPRLKSLTLARTFRVTKYVKKWREEKRNGDMVEVSDLNTEMVIEGGCGYLMTGVI